MNEASTHMCVDPKCNLCLQTIVQQLFVQLTEAGARVAMYEAGRSPEKMNWEAFNQAVGVAKAIGAVK